jgi:prephenate dehydrogenase
MIERIAILGTGLLGASAGLALRAAGYGGELVGWNRNPENGRAALEKGAVDRLVSDSVEAARTAQVTLLAVPVLASLGLMEQLAAALGPDQLVTDVGSTKARVAETAARLYNALGKPAFLPGHPMAGKERGGAELGDAQLFESAVWIFTDDPQAQRTPAASALVNEWREWTAAMGARTLDLAPARHDELVAWVSHLPQFLATALSALLEEQEDKGLDLHQVGGRALREMTRLGSSPFSMWRDIAHTNTEPIERALLALEQRLAHLRENLRTPALREEFEQANRFRKE